MERSTESFLVGEPRSCLRGVKTEVAVRTERGGEIVVWTFGKDAYPPKFSAGGIVRPE